MHGDSEEAWQKQLWIHHSWKNNTSWNADVCRQCGLHVRWLRGTVSATIHTRNTIKPYHEPVVGDVKSAQRVEIVEVLGKCLDLVGGHVEHLERAQLPYVWHELFDLVRMHVQGDQQLYANHLTVFIVWDTELRLIKTLNYINYSNTTKNNILIIDVSASRRKPSSGLTSGAGRQYVKACPIRGSIGSSPRLDLCFRSSWSISPPLWVCQLCLILDQSPWRSPSLSHDSNCKHDLWLQICCRYWLPWSFVLSYSFRVNLMNFSHKDS